MANLNKSRDGIILNGVGGREEAPEVTSLKRRVVKNGKTTSTTLLMEKKLILII